MAELVLFVSDVAKIAISAQTVLPKMSRLKADKLIRIFSLVRSAHHLSVLLVQLVPFLFQISNPLKTSTISVNLGQARCSYFQLFPNRQFIHLSLHFILPVLISVALRILLIMSTFRLSFTMSRLVVQPPFL